MSDHYTADGSHLWISKAQPMYAQTVCTVHLIEGAWPSTSELLTICDNRSRPDDKTAHHFGGSVQTDGKTAIVVVHTD